MQLVGGARGIHDEVGYPQYRQQNGHNNRDYHARACYPEFPGMSGVRVVHLAGPVTTLDADGKVVIRVTANNIRLYNAAPPMLANGRLSVRRAPSPPADAPRGPPPGLAILGGGRLFVTSPDAVDPDGKPAIRRSLTAEIMHGALSGARLRLVPTRDVFDVKPDGGIAIEAVVVRNGAFVGVYEGIPTTENIACDAADDGSHIEILATQKVRRALATATGGGNVTLARWTDDASLPTIEVTADATAGGTVCVDLPAARLAPIRGAAKYGGELRAPSAALAAEFVVRSGGRVEHIDTSRAWSAGAGVPR